MEIVLHSDSRTKSSVGVPPTAGGGSVRDAVDAFLKRWPDLEGVALPGTSGRDGPWSVRDALRMFVRAERIFDEDWMEELAEWVQRAAPSHAILDELWTRAEKVRSHASHSNPRVIPSLLSALPD